MIQNQYHPRQYQYTPRTHVRERPLHWFIILVALLFVFLLIIESVAFIVLGAWHLTIPRLQTLLTLSDQIYRRELGFGILLVIIGSFGVALSILGLIAFFTLRLALLRIVRAVSFHQLTDWLIEYFSLQYVCGF
jgi:small-conductance mechanosensitive channel